MTIVDQIMLFIGYKYSDNYKDYIKRSAKDWEDVSDYVGNLNDNSSDDAYTTEERYIKNLLADDWNSHLTCLKKYQCETEIQLASNPLESLKLVAVLDEWNLIVQALDKYDFYNPGRGAVVVAKLYTEKLRKQYKGYTVGYVWRFNSETLIAMNERDAYSDLYKLLDYKSLEKLKTALAYQQRWSNVFGFINVNDSTLAPFSKFKSLATDENEIIIDRVPLNEMVGIWASSRAPDDVKTRAKCMAIARNLPYCEEQDGKLSVYSTQG